MKYAHRLCVRNVARLFGGQKENVFVINAERILAFGRIPSDVSFEMDARADNPTSGPLIVHERQDFVASNIRFLFVVAPENRRKVRARVYGYKVGNRPRDT